MPSRSEVPFGDGGTDLGTADFADPAADGTGLRTAGVETGASGLGALSVATGAGDGAGAGPASAGIGARSRSSGNGVSSAAVAGLAASGDGAGAVEAGGKEGPSTPSTGRGMAVVATTVSIPSEVQLTQGRANRFIERSSLIAAFLSGRGAPDIDARTSSFPRSTFRSHPDSRKSGRCKTHDVTSLPSSPSRPLLTTGTTSDPA
jgi:hypothetical protein